MTVLRLMLIVLMLPRFLILMIRSFSLALLMHIFSVPSCLELNEAEPNPQVILLNLSNDEPLDGARLPEELILTIRSSSLVL